jgi:hypothetical protein
MSAGSRVEVNTSGDLRRTALMLGALAVVVSAVGVGIGLVTGSMWGFPMVIQGGGILLLGCAVALRFVGARRR